MLAAAAAPASFTLGNVWDWLEVITWAIALIIIVAFAVSVLLAFRNGQISLTGVIAEPDGKASLSRFQALLFTFVFIIALAYIVLKSGQFPTEFSPSVLTMLGGSYGTYLVSKGIQRGMGGGGDGDAVAAAAGGGAAQTSNGPLIRLGKNAPAVLAAGVRLPATIPLPTTGESTFLIPAGKNTFGPQLTVATAIADISLSISATGVAAGVNYGGQVEYLPPGAGAPQTQSFVNTITVQTDPNVVSDVKVQWNANADGVVVTTIVS
jgi:hypothetical protein